MNKLKSKITIYRVLLGISWLFIVLLIVSIIDLEGNNKYTENTTYLSNIYETAYTLINKKSDNSFDSCNIIDINSFTNYFTDDLKSKLTDDLVLEMNTYYNCDNIFDGTVFDNKGIRKFNVVMENDEYILVKTTDNKYILYKKVDDKWFIDMFE